jgi:hypothetical protein
VGRVFALFANEKQEMGEEISKKLESYYTNYVKAMTPAGK